ncbi:FtsK/SpoIIIE domain-containing protein [Actinomycetospora sp. CA-101289]|uniref:FtsK/SpoIIIE domain-containing protein n=1 Tax=Actinomycetospora sp. CA-101289 TaxID=3239893 RepID=UPI003D963EA0
MTLFTPRRRRSAQSELWAQRERTTGYRPAWRAVCEGVGLVHSVDVAAGTTVIVPKLVDVSSDPEPVLTVELLPGQLAEDLAAQAHRIAPAMGAVCATVEPYGLRWARVRLSMADPLADAFHAQLAPVAAAAARLILGRAEDGDTIAHALAESAHLLVQGQNGSGKSRFTYGLLAQCAHAADVLVTGSDITGLLLGGPWDGTRHRDHQAAGTADLDAHAAVLEELVAEMDRRLANMPRGVDKLDPTAAVPLLLVVLEEFPGLLRAAGSLPKPAKGERSVLDRIKSATLRLLSEGRKVAVRVLMLAQRAEAEATGGGYAREQFALVVSFRVPADSLVMGHGDDARELGAAHRTAAPGIAVVSAPGRPLCRMRAPWFGEYVEYVDAVGPAAELDRPTLRLVGDDPSEAAS